MKYLTSVASSHPLDCFSLLHSIEVVATTTTPMFAILRDALLFQEICHHFTAATPLRLNAINNSFFELSFFLLYTLHLVIMAEITKHTQVRTTWRCITVDNTSRRLVMMAVPSSLPNHNPEQEKFIYQHDQGSTMTRVALTPIDAHSCVHFPLILPTGRMLVPRA